jgi:hypothetical protein
MSRQREEGERKVQASFWVKESTYKKLMNFTNYLKDNTARGISQSDVITFLLDEVLNKEKSTLKTSLEKTLRTKYAGRTWSDIMKR